MELFVLHIVVRTNISSELFPVSRGTQQGCPLSPLLFAIVIEPLACASRQTRQLNGVFREGQEHRVSLYVDDLLMYLSDTLPSALDIIWILSPVNAAARTLTFDTFPFKVTSKCAFFGVTVPDCFSKLFKENFIPLMTKVE